MEAKIREFNAERQRIERVLVSIGGTFFNKSDMAIKIAVFLVSVKIVLMIHAQHETSHFQFWMLNTIGFRINKMKRESQ